MVRAPVVWPKAIFINMGGVYGQALMPDVLFIAVSHRGFLLSRSDSFVRPFVHLPNPTDPVGIELGIGADHLQILDDRLRDQ